MALWKLNPMDFTKMNPTRQAKIAAAPAKALPATDSYVPNQIAKALHPGKQHVKVAKVIEQSADTKTFWLEADAAKGTEALAWFSAGQYLSVSLEIGPMKLTRPYSLSSSPREALAGRYGLTIKRVEGGLASNYILDNWVVGTEVEVSEPLGVFTYEPLRDAKTVIGIAGEKDDYTIPGLSFCGGHYTRGDGYSSAYIVGDTVSKKVVKKLKGGA